MTRREWLALLEREVENPDAPGGERLWAPALDAAPRERLREIQGRKLVAAVSYMHARSALFRAKCERLGLEPGDVRGVDDLTKLPITTKEEMSRDLAEHPPFGTYTALSDDEWLAEGWQVFQTSGTTGTPRPFRYTAFDRRMWAWTDARALYAMGIRSGRDVALLCFGYGPHVAMWGMNYGFQLMSVPVVPGGVDTRTRCYLIDRYRPTVIAATPSYALHLAATMREAGGDPPASSVRRVIVMGEPTPSTSERRIAAAWDAEVHQFYGCTEAAPSCGGYTCGHELHVMEDTHLLETVDPDTLQPVPEGEPGVAVVTNLCSDSSPQIRFLIGDYTTLAYEPCTCGRTHVRAVGGFSGRSDDMLNVRGVTLFPSAIEDVLRGVPDLGEEFQIVLTTHDELDELTLVAEAAPAVRNADYEPLAHRVADLVRARLELRAVVEILPPGTLPRTELKAKRVRDERPASASRA